MVVRITNYGARIEQILVPDRDGQLGDVAQGYETLEQVIAKTAARYREIAARITGHPMEGVDR